MENYDKITEEEWNQGLNAARERALSGELKAMKDTAAFVRYGRLFNENNFKDALKWYKMAADAGDAESAEEAGMICMQLKDLTTARTYLFRAAQAGRADAQNCYGACYKFGLGGPEDIVKAKYWFQKAAEQNHPRAQWNLFDTIMGNRAEDDWKALDEATYWLKRAYANDQEDAIDFARRSNIVDDDFLSEIEEIRRSSSTSGTPGKQQAATYEELLNQAKEKAAAGDVPSMIRVAELLYDGPDKKQKNEQAAFPWWKMAADHGDALSALKVGSCYIEHRKSPEDAERAIPYLKKAAEQGRLQANYLLGYCYAEGIFRTRDYELAAKYCRPAALKGDKDAQYEMAFCMDRLNDRDSSYSWTIAAALNGHEKAKKMFNNAYANNPSEVQKELDEEIRAIKRNGNLPLNTEIRCNNKNSSNSGSGSTGGCYVATCIYGSYDCPQVWTLRRFRDNTLAATWYGRAFVRLYYTVSPKLVKWFGDTHWFRHMWKGKLDRMVAHLQAQGVESTPYHDRW